MGVRGHPDLAAHGAGAVQRRGRILLSTLLVGLIYLLGTWALAGTDWAAVAAATAPLLLEPKALVEALAAAGAATRFCELDPPVPADIARWALGNCHFMRNRFTVVDLAWFLGGWDSEAVEDVLAEAGRLGAGL